MRHVSRSIGAALLAAMCAGCGFYSVSGSLPSHIETVAVPLFDNETTEPRVVEDVTDAVTDAIISNGSMKIAAEFVADAVVQGTIVDVIDEPDQFTKNETAQRFIIRILANVTFFDRVRNKPIWSQDSLEGWARYDASGAAAGEDVETREDAKKTALDMLAKEVIDRTVAGW